MPSTRKGYWRKKLEGNKQRDALNRRRLRRLGWRVMTVWECQLRPHRLEATRKRLGRFLRGR